VKNIESKEYSVPTQPL